MHNQVPFDGPSRRDFLGTAAAGTAALYLGSSATPAQAKDKAGGLHSAPADRSRWPELAEVALEVLKKSKVDYGDIRLIDTRNQSVRAS